MRDRPAQHRPPGAVRTGGAMTTSTSRFLGGSGEAVQWTRLRGRSTGACAI